MKQVQHQEIQQLIIEHIAFAKRHAALFHRKRSNLGFDLEDFEGAALLGLCDAARRYQASRGMQFPTYAYFRIKGAMFDLLRDGGGIRRRQFNRIVEATRTRSEIASTQQTAPAPESNEVSYCFARTIEELADLMHTLDEVGVRVHKTLDGGAELSYAAENTPEDALTCVNGRKYLKRLISQLPDKQRTVLELRYFEDYSFEEISDQLGGLSKSWVSRIHTNGLDKLRELIIEEQRECRKRMAADQESHAA